MRNKLFADRIPTCSLRVCTLMFSRSGSLRSVLCPLSIALAIASLQITALCGADTVFHVAATGSDFASGTRSKPFATPSRAAEAVRQAAANAAPGGRIRVVVHAGNYVLEHSLDPGVQAKRGISIDWHAAAGEEVHLLGGKQIPASAFKAVTNPEVSSRLDAVARGHVLAADLGALGIQAISPFPENYHGAPPGPELYFNSARMELAHWPNKGWATIEKILDAGSLPREGDTSNRPGRFRPVGNRSSRWNEADGVWLQGYWCFDWYDEVIRVGSINHAENSITLARPHVYSLRQGNPSPRRYRALNVLEELDSPGEFYIDRNSRTLYFWPPSDIKSAAVTLATLETPLVNMHGESNVRFSGFVLEAGIAGGMELTDCSQCVVQGCEVKGMRLTGITITGGVRDKVVDCVIHDTGTGGLTLEGGNRVTLTPGLHEAINCHIYNFSIHQQTAAYGLTFGGVGCKASHCEIHDAPHQAIFVGGNDHVFEYCEIYRVCTETDDCGALYKGRNPSCRGNHIQFNYWHDIGSPMGHGNAAIYFDDGDGGDTVDGNIFTRCGDPGRGPFGTVFSHGGHGIIARNNLFIDCKRAFGSAPWDDKRWLNALNGGEDCFFPKKLLQDVNITQPPYTTHYPELKGFMNPSPGANRNSFATENILINCGDAHGGNWLFDKDKNLMLSATEGFSGIQKAELPEKIEQIQSELPGFKPLHIEQMGLLRRKLPQANQHKFSSLFYTSSIIHKIFISTY